MKTVAKGAKALGQAVGQEVVGYADGVGDDG